MIWCEPYRCRIAEAACAQRHVTSLAKGTRVHLTLCQQCEDGATRAAMLGNECEHKDARFMPRFGRWS